ncbi:MAG: hypothetical protein NT062_10965 [Proteobacteria bacterium]|nr:hypothetical protein [Pseudomonadota bacterium]
MAKKKTKHKKQPYRNAAPPRATTTPRAPRAPKDDDTSLRRLGYTAAGAAGTALVGSFLSREGWAPKTIATALAAVGAGLAWKGDESTIRSVGAGAMSAAGSQLALMLIDDHEHKVAAAAPPQTADATKKPANAGELPPGSLESAFERAKTRLAISAGDSMAA